MSAAAVWVTILLLLLNAFFVGAEFALVRSRRTRLVGMARAGDAKARWALRGVGNSSRLRSASPLPLSSSALLGASSLPRV